MIISELLKKGAQRFDVRTTAILDAELLLMHVLGVEKEYLFRNADEDVEDDLVKLFFQYIERVFDGEPVEYITGVKEFFGYDFLVDERALIPRPETEFLVEMAIDFLENNAGKFVLDVGTGSGNIAVSIAKYFMDKEIEAFQHIDATDVCNDALEVARSNAQQHGVDDKIHFFESDLLENIENEERYDVILANLPYIGERKHRYVSASAEKYEPYVALFGGEDGLKLYEKLFEQILKKKINYGMMLGEFGFAQGEDMRELLNKNFDQKDWQIQKDLAGIDRYFIVNNK